MAAVTAHKIAAGALASRVAGITTITKEISVVNGLAAQNDTIELFDLPAGFRVIGGRIGHTASLGADATAQLKMGSANLTAATTAAGASDVQITGLSPAVDAASRTVAITIAGAGVTGTTGTLYAYVLIDRIG